jgi:hypothetical protein
MKTWHNSPAPIGRIGQPGELGPAYVFLASADGSFISGQSYVLIQMRWLNNQNPCKWRSYRQWVNRDITYFGFAMLVIMQLFPIPFDPCVVLDCRAEAVDVTLTSSIRA